MRLFVACAVTGLFACQTARPVSSTYTLRKETGAECTAHCGELGMKMSAVVIIADMTGCVCEPEGPQHPAAGGAAATSSGTVAALMAVRAVQQQRQQQQNIHAPSPTPPPMPH